MGESFTIDLCEIYKISERGVFSIYLDCRQVPSPAFLPTILVLLFLLFPSNPRSNVLISDLAGFVNGKDEATKMKKQVSPELRNTAL